ncbi:hypothetical protein [Dactylosporangium sp. NPDC005555]|uniref:hypothetical protein n=1 Tax=Dactylosporangium sp. NPDC005555 TaxID=3154889 RepID=UPI0033A2DC62
MADELSDAEKARKDLLWGMYTDLRAHSRHAETLRANVVNFTVVIASALVAVIINDGRVGRSDLALCVVIVITGLSGLAFAASYTELHERNRLRAMRIREALDVEFFANAPATISGLLNEADAPHEASSLFRHSRGLIGSTQRFWLFVPLFAVLAGVLLGVVAL